MSRRRLRPQLLKQDIAKTKCIDSTSLGSGHFLHLLFVYSCSSHIVILLHPSLPLYLFLHSLRNPVVEFQQREENQFPFLSMNPISRRVERSAPSNPLSIYSMRCCQFGYRRDEHVRLKTVVAKISENNSNNSTLLYRLHDVKVATRPITFRKLLAVCR